MRKPVVVASLLVLLAGASTVLAQGTASYEPQQRLRTSMETCMKSEFESGAYCVKRCAPDFRLDASSKKPRCVATKSGAKYDPPKPSYQPPARQPGAAPVPGA